jgi:hypothetical protein
MLWLTENDADQSSDTDAEPKLRRRFTISTNNNIEPIPTDGQLEYARIRSFCIQRVCHNVHS